MDTFEIISSASGYHLPKPKHGLPSIAEVNFKLYDLKGNPITYASREELEANVAKAQQAHAKLFKHSGDIYGVIIKASPMADGWEVKLKTYIGRVDEGEGSLVYKNKFDMVYNAARLDRAVNYALTRTIEDSTYRLDDVAWSVIVEYDPKLPTSFKNELEKRLAEAREHGLLDN